MIRRIAVLTSLVWLALLAGCSGTIQRETHGKSGGAAGFQGSTFSGVEVVLSEGARKLQAENPQFSVRELADYIRRRLEAGELLREDAPHKVEVVVESFRVRSAAAAVLLGIMAGTDSIQGRVRVLDARGRQVHGYKVDASYGLGGWGGGQDGMRMNWLYDKFSELTVAELAGATTPANLARKSGGSGAASAAQGGAARSATAVNIAPSASTGTSIRPAQPSAPQAQKAAQPAPGSREAAVAAAAQAAEMSNAARVSQAAGVQGAPASRPDTAGASPVVMAAAPVQATPVPAPAATSAPKVHRRAVPAPSGYATIDNVDAVPVRTEGKARYQHYLSLPPPKAFAIYEDGSWRFWFSSGDAMTNVLDHCAREGRKCWLYAVDNTVVWREDLAQRYGRSDQLATK